MSRRRKGDPERVPSRFGTPGQSAAQERKRLLTTYRALPLRTKVTGVLLVAILVGAWGYGQTGSWSSAALAATVIGLATGAVAFAFARPGVAATLVVLAGYTLLIAGVVGATFGLAASGDPGKAANGIVVAALFGPIVAILAHLTSRGRPWLTTLIALTVGILGGLILLFLVPQLGFWWAVLLSGMVLFLRGGGWEWVLDTASGVLDRVRPSRDFTSPVAGEVLQAREEAAIRTAALFDALGEDWVVLHDVAVQNGKKQRFRREHSVVEHVLIGPGGPVVVVSRLASGSLDNDPDYGISLDGTPVAPSMLRLSVLRDHVARALRLDPESVGAIMVLHGAFIRNGRMRVGLYNGQGEPYGETYAVNEASLVDEIRGRPALWSSRRVRRLAHRARAALPPATAAGLRVTSAIMDDNRDRVANQPNPEAYSSGISKDGHPVSKSPRVSPEPPLWFRESNGDAPKPLILSSDNTPTTKVGQQVTLLTEEGTFSGMRVVSDPYVEDQVALVLVCTEDEWHTALDENSSVNGYPFPLASISPS